MKINKEEEKKKLDALLAKSHGELKSFGIPVANLSGITLEVSPKLSYDKAYCHCDVPNEKYKIILPTACYKELGEKPETKRRIYHELAHTCPECMAHNHMFGNYRDIIIAKTDYDIYTHVDDPASSHLPVLARLECPKCHAVYIDKKQDRWTQTRMERLVDTYKQGYYDTCSFCGAGIPKRNVEIHVNNPAHAVSGIR